MPRGPDKKPRKRGPVMSEKFLLRRRRDLMTILPRLEFEAREVGLLITARALNTAAAASSYEVGGHPGLAEGTLIDYERQQNNGGAGRPQRKHN